MPLPMNTKIVRVSTSLGTEGHTSSEHHSTDDDTTGAEYDTDPNDVMNDKTN